MLLGGCQGLVYGSSFFFGDVVLDRLLLFLYGKRREGGYIHGALYAQDAVAYMSRRYRYGSSFAPDAFEWCTGQARHEAG